MAPNFLKFLKLQRKPVVRKDSAEYLKDPRNADAANSLSKAFYAHGLKKIIVGKLPLPALAFDIRQVRGKIINRNAPLIIDPHFVVALAEVRAVLPELAEKIIRYETLYHMRMRELLNPKVHKQIFGTKPTVKSISSPEFRKKARQLLTAGTYRPNYNVKPEERTECLASLMLMNFLGSTVAVKGEKRAAELASAKNVRWIVNMEYNAPDYQFASAKEKEATSNLTYNLIREFFYKRALLG